MGCGDSGKRTCHRKKRKKCFRTHARNYDYEPKNLFNSCCSNLCDVTLYHYKNGKGVKDRRRCAKGRYWACGVHNVTGQTVCACR